MAIITIIGVGQMGSALGFVAADRGTEVRMVGSPVDGEVVEVCRREGRHPKVEIPFPEGIRFYYCKQWKEAVEGADFVIGAVSSFGVDWFLKDILMQLDPAVPVLSAAKGLVGLPDGSLVSYPAYWERELATVGIVRDIYALGGPGTADGIIRRDPTHVCLCGRESALLKMMKKALQGPRFHISITHDAAGLEAAVAIKNAYALGVAIALGRANRLDKGGEQPHCNSQAAVFYQAAKEMLHILQLQNAELDSALVGIGDLYVTVTGARTRRLGLLLGEGKTCDEAQEIMGGATLESLVVVRRLAAALTIKAQKGEVNIDDFPLLQYVIGVLDSGKANALPWSRFTYENV